MLAACAGVCIALQAAANGRLRGQIQSPEWTAFFSICGTITCATLAMLILRPPAPSMADVKNTEWWNWIGGPLGALIVLAGAVLTPKLGGAAFLAFVIAGQLLAGATLDHYGLMGIAERAMSAPRILGAVLVVVGAILIRFC
jgi:transporter family-2 protein